MSPRISHNSISADARALALAALLISAAGAAACTSRAEAADDEPTAATPVRVRAATAVERPTAVTASGAVDANTTAEMAFKVGGRIVRVPVEEGQPVRAGQLLAAIDAGDYRLNATQAAARATQAADEYERMRALYERGSLAPNDYVKFETAAQVAAAQAELAFQQFDDTRLVSPISGIVARRAIDVGEMVAPGTPLFSIVAVDPITIRVGIPEAQMGLVRRGAAATVAVPALAGPPFPARVRMIGVSADPTSRTYPVELDVPNPGHELLPGMIAEARIEGDRITRALTVPGEAIVRDAEGATLLFIYFPDERRVHARRVAVGSPLGREIEITEGLHAGELVVVGGQDRLREGALVAATAAPAESDVTTITSGDPEGSTP
jgi:membrane fusion protein (multidrug efflux system)